MENVKTDLRVVFVDTNRRVIREVLTECHLFKNEMPNIFITDHLIVDMLGGYEDMPIPFYDIENDRFNFKTSKISDLSKHNEPIPDEIILEIMEVVDEDTDNVQYIHLEPGLWKADDEGSYRMCDDSILHILMETKILPMVEDNMIGFEDGAAMTLFFSLHDNLSFHYFDNRNDEDEDDEEGDNDDNECDGACENCPRCSPENCDKWDECEIKDLDFNDDEDEDDYDKPVSCTRGDIKCSHECCKDCDCKDGCEGFMPEPEKKLPVVVIHKRHRKHSHR